MTEAATATTVEAPTTEAIPPPETPAAEAPPPEPAKEPTLAERRKALADAAAAEKAKRADRNKERARIAALETERTRIQQELAQERAAREAEAKRMQALEDEAKDALTFLHKRGVAAKDIAERVLKENSPENVNAELKAKLDAIEKARLADKQEYEDRIKKAEHERAVSAARKELLDTFDSKKDKLPILSKICTTPERLERDFLEAYKTIDAHPETRGQAHTFSNAEILDAMEVLRRADLEAALEGFETEALEKHLTRRKPAAKLESKDSPAGAPQGTEGAKAAKTLTNGMAVGGKQWFPDNFHKLPDKEQNRLLREALAKGWRG